MTSHGFEVAETVGVRGHVLVFIADERPDLPAVQTVAVPDVAERIDIIVGDDIAFPRFDEKWKHHKIKFVVEQAVF